MMEIEKLNKSRLEEIRELWQELNAHYQALSTHFTDHFLNLTFPQRVAQLSRKDKLVVFLAKERQRRIGYCVATVHEGLGEIDSLYVSLAYRGNGVGEALVARALHWLEGHKCKKINVFIAAGNEDAEQFYHKFGFAKRFIVMQKVE